MRTATTIGPVLVLVVLAAACASGPAEGSGASVIEDDDTEAADAAAEPGEDDVDPEDAGEVGEADEAPAADDAELGTRTNPLEIGTRIEMGGWSLAVTDVTLDATDLVMEENQFNDPPAEGRQFVLFAVDATYEGEESGTAWLDFSWAIVGSEGNTFGTAMDDYCGSIPSSLDDTGETFPGGSVSGNVCVSVESAQVDGGTIRIEESLSFDDTRAFYALS